MLYQQSLQYLQKLGKFDPLPIIGGRVMPQPALLIADEMSSFTLLVAKLNESH